MDLDNESMDTFGVAVRQCLIEFLGKGDDEASALVATWRADNPAGSGWCPLGERHVEPLAKACELAYAGFPELERLAREADVWRLHRSAYHGLKARIMGVTPGAPRVPDVTSSDDHVHLVEPGEAAA